MNGKNRIVENAAPARALSTTLTRVLRWKRGSSSYDSLIHLALESKKRVSIDQGRHPRIIEDLERRAHLVSKMAYSKQSLRRGNVRIAERDDRKGFQEKHRGD